MRTTRRQGMRPETLAKIILVILLLVLAGLLYYYMVVLPKMGGGIVDKTESGASIGDIEFLYAIYGSNAGSDPYFSKPMGVATDKFENIYVTDSDAHKVYVFARGGRFLYGFGGFGVAWPEAGFPATWEPGRFNVPYGIDVDKKNGDIYVADMMNQQIQVFNSNGRFLRAFPKPWEVVGRGGGGKGQGLLPTVLALHNNELYVADAYQIAIYNKKTGKFIQQFGRPGRKDDGIDRPNGIAVAKDGTVYLADSNHIRLQAFKPTGKGKKRKFSLKWVTGEIPESALSVDTAGNRQFGLPRGVDIDNAGNIFVIDTFHFSIQAYDKNGKKIGEVGDRGVNGGQFNFPNDIAITGSGIAYVADRANQRVQAIRIPTMIKGGVLPKTQFPWWPFLLLLPLLIAAYLLLRKPIYVASADFLAKVVANGDVAQFVAAMKKVLVTPDVYNEYADYVQDEQKMGNVLKIAKQDPEAIQAYVDSWDITGDEAELLISGRRNVWQRLLMIKPVFLLEKIDLRNKLEDAGYATINHEEFIEQLKEKEQAKTADKQ